MLEVVSVNTDNLDMEVPPLSQSSPSLHKSSLTDEGNPDDTDETQDYIQQQVKLTTIEGINSRLFCSFQVKRLSYMI